MTLALERILAPATGYGSKSVRLGGTKLNVTVVFTSIHATLSALQQASAMANDLHGRITLVVPQIVPYPLPLKSPPVLIDWNERRFQVFAGGIPIETKVSV